MNQLMERLDVLEDLQTEALFAGNEQLVEKIDQEIIKIENEFNRIDDWQRDLISLG